MTRLLWIAFANAAIVLGSPAAAQMPVEIPLDQVLRGRQVDEFIGQRAFRGLESEVPYRVVCEAYSEAINGQTFTRLRNCSTDSPLDAAGFERRVRLRQQYAGPVAFTIVLR